MRNKSRLEEDGVLRRKDVDVEEAVNSRDDQKSCNGSEAC